MDLKSILVHWEHIYGRINGKLCRLLFEEDGSGGLGILRDNIWVSKTSRLQRLMTQTHLWTTDQRKIVLSIIWEGGTKMNLRFKEGNIWLSEYHVSMEQRECIF